MRLTFRNVAIIASSALLSAAAMAANAPTGIIAVADHAHVDGADATLGANVYSGDALETNDNGSLHLRVGSGQLFLLAATDATLAQDQGRVDARVARGTAGFSAVVSDPLEIETPVGVLRPADKARAFGQVTITGPNQVVITSYEGNLLLSREGEERTIEAGKAYRVTLVEDASADPAAPEPQGSAGVGTHHHHHWVFDAIVAGGAAGGGYALWRWMTESDWTPSGN